MNRGLGFLVASAGILLAAGMANAAAKTAVRAANIMATSGQGTITAGPCNTGVYDSICPSGNCQCLTITGAKVTGSMAGTGTADLSVTEDIGSETTSSGDTCTPFFGVANLTTTLQKTPLTESLNLGGMSCDALTPNSKNTIQGGFGIQDGASNGATGWGTVFGTSKSQATTLHLKGSITQ